MKRSYPIHPLANLLPMMPRDSVEYARFRDSVRVHGAKPITLFEDQVLDGRHRLWACEDTGQEPEFVEYEGDDPVGFLFARTSIGDR
jgi:hypothetical protein